MKLEENNEIKACLPKSRTLFYYYKDRYTLELLADSVEKPKPMRELKQSPFAGLLRKPIVQDVLAGWYAHRHCKRKGHNLVLHMNFSNQHDTIYQHTFRFPKSSPFCWGGHPRNRQGRNTLA